MDLPADLKYIAPYLQRGQELAEREPIISYYGRVFPVYDCLTVS